MHVLTESPVITMGNGHNGILVFFPPGRAGVFGFEPGLVPLFEKTLDGAQAEMVKRILTGVQTDFPNLSWVQTSISFEPNQPPVLFLNVRVWQRADPTRPKSGAGTSWRRKPSGMEGGVAPELDPNLQRRWHVRSGRRGSLVFHLDGDARRGRASRSGELPDELYDEAEILDARRYVEWLALLVEEIRYRMTYPLHEEGKTAASHARTAPIFDETALSLQIRVQQMGQPSLTIAEPPTVIRRFVTNIRVRKGYESSRYRVTSPVLLCRFRFTQPQPQFLSARRENVIERFCRAPPTRADDPPRRGGHPGHQPELLPL
jgi:PAH dioxygenase small subunit